MSEIKDQVVPNKDDLKPKLNSVDEDEIKLDKIVTPGQLVWKRFKRNKLALVGVSVLLFMFIFSFIGPFITGYGETEIFKDAADKFLLETGPSKDHWLGTDKDGMDIMSRLMYGGQVSLTIGFIVITFEMFIGIIMGGIAGYYGKWVDNLIMRIVDVINCIPQLPVMLIIGAIVDSLHVDEQYNIYIIMLVLGIIGWTGIARMVRGQILSLREQEFMVATEATGLRVSRRIFKHLVPNVIPQLIVIATMGLGGIILTEAALSFLGFGVKHPEASWGNMVNNVRSSYDFITHWHRWLPAGICIFVTVLAFNFLGDGLRDAYDPKMKR